MKRWRKYLLSIWTPVVILIALNFYVWAQLHIDLGLYSDIGTISQKQRNLDAVLQRECCDRGCNERIVLRRWLLDTEIFVYEPAGRDPNQAIMVWLNPNELQITIDRVNHIYSQETEARGVKITYRIGKVDDPYP